MTGLITCLAWYPLPLIHSILLRPDIIITSDTPSFHQVLRILKQQIDAELPVSEDSLEVIDLARSYLIDREFRVINARKANESLPVCMAKNMNTYPSLSQSVYAPISASSPVQVTPSSSYDPFKRYDNKRKSISRSITSIFNRKSNGKYIIIAVSVSLSGVVCSLTETFIYGFTGFYELSLFSSFQI